MKSKATVTEIRRRFDGDVERFADLDTGQGSTVDLLHKNSLFAAFGAIK